ncbi:MAG: dTDP-4-dehydrorhamnose reductase [Dactylosporangium sp.]|nr:dTDP-4-dehydrorhamnose reductase [Dactylosporangium sp.]NNJ62847.1 dTDP-4-dehydrorhamnose reductase [Dactylosporangium sp.]
MTGASTGLPDPLAARVANRRWLVTGAHGMLGRDLVAILTAAGATVTVTDRDEVDITDLAATRSAVADHDLVVNTAAWTNVDAAEANEEAATRINGLGPTNLATACTELGARLLHVSTDYVLAGDASAPYSEHTPPDPINAYGRSKLVGEQAVLRLAPAMGYLVRTAWLYGAHGGNFVATVLRLAEQREHLDIVDDQRGQPTWAYALALRLVELGVAAVDHAAPAGIYHGTASGETTWFGLARAVFAEAGLDPDRIRPTTSDRYPRPARRPTYSVLAHSGWAQAGLPPLDEWRRMLTLALPSLLAARQTSA